MRCFFQQTPLNNAKISRLLHYSPKEIVEDAQKRREIGQLHAKRYIKHTNENNQIPKYKLGSFVRYIKDKTQFGKGYKGQFSDDMKQITKIEETNEYILLDFR